MNRQPIYILLVGSLTTLSCSDFGSQPQIQQPTTLTQINAKLSNWYYGDTNRVVLQGRVTLRTRRDSMLVLDSAKITASGKFSLQLPSMPDSIILPTLIVQIDSGRKDSARICIVSDLLVLAPSGQRIGWARNCNATFWQLWLLSDYSAFYVYSDRDISDHQVYTGAAGGKPYTMYVDVAYKRGWNKVVDRVTEVSGSHRTFTRRVESDFAGEWYLFEW